MKSLKSLLAFAQEQPIPRGAMSLEQIANREGVSLDHARRLCYRGRDAGIVKIHIVRRRAANGVIRPHSFYEFVNPKKK